MVGLTFQQKQTQNFLSDNLIENGACILPFRCSIKLDNRNMSQGKEVRYNVRNCYMFARLGFLVSKIVNSNYSIMSGVKYYLIHHMILCMIYI